MRIARKMAATAVIGAAIAAATLVPACGASAMMRPNGAWFTVPGAQFPFYDDCTGYGDIQVKNGTWLSYHCYWTDSGYYALDAFVE